MKIQHDGWTLVEYDHHTKRSVWSYYDGQNTVYRIDQPVEETIKVNREVRNATAGHKWGEGQLVASIPANVYWSELSEASEQQDDKYLHKWLNDGDNAAFRTFEGKL